MIRFFLSIFLFISSLYAKECSPYFNPEKFYDAPEYLVEILDEQFPSHKIFQTEKNYEKRAFIQEKPTEYIKPNSFQDHGEYRYPIINGLWKYKTQNQKVDEVNISRAEIYRFKDEEIANSINDDFDNFWMDFIEDGYSMQLTPEQTLFRYNDEYFTFSVYIYGIDGDATPLKGTVVNFWFKNYTNEVNNYIQCDKENNASR